MPTPTPADYRRDPPLCDLCRHLYCEPGQPMCEDCLEHRRRCDETARRVMAGVTRWDRFAPAEERAVKVPRIPRR